MSASRPEATEPNFEGQPDSECPEHRTVGPHRAWCYNDGEWCYPQMPCRGCMIPMLRRALREIAALTEGLEGLTAQRMMMRGVSPIGLLGKARDIAKTALELAT